MNYRRLIRLFEEKGVLPRKASSYGTKMLGQLVLNENAFAV